MTNTDVTKDSAGDMMCIERRMTRAMIKRTSIVASIRAVHALSLRVMNKPDLMSELIISVDGLGALRSEFEAEDNTVLDCLIELNAVKNYSANLAPEIRGLINASKAVAS